MAEKRTTRVTVFNESLYGERDTMNVWQERIEEWFARVPPEYRNVAILEIDSVGGYEGEHHTEATIYYDRPETTDETNHRKNIALARADEARGLAARWLADAERLRKEAEGSGPSFTRDNRRWPDMPDIPQDQWDKINEAAFLVGFGLPPQNYRTTADRILAGVKAQQQRIEELEEIIRRGFDHPSFAKIEQQ